MAIRAAGRWLSRRVGSGRNKMSRGLLKLAWFYCRAYHNSANFDLQKNGEAQLLDALVTENLKVIFDVGAHVGEWALRAASTFPSARILCFEPVPDLYNRLADNTREDSRFELKRFALSEEAKSGVPFFYRPNAPSMSSFSGTMETGIGEEEISVDVQTGDDLCRHEGIDTIDFLKVDAEGFDYSVLKGFSGMISKQRIRIIQFENLSILNDVKLQHREGAGLWQVVELLGDEYLLGRILPTGVDFTPYRREDEIFGGNFFAVRRAEETIIGLVEV
jgi:FkbM family methyltransferase